MGSLFSICFQAEDDMLRSSQLVHGLSDGTASIWREMVNITELDNSFAITNQRTRLV